VLESSGASIADTSVTFAARAGRTIVLRHAAPDDAIFLMIAFPAATDTMARDSIHLAIHPTPGRYGFTLSTSDKLTAGATATFSYAVHFRTPAEAVTKYPSPGRFEQVLHAATIGADNKVQLITGQHPAADMLRFPLTASGNYALVAAR